jgi:hypothetical protein
MFYLIQNSVAFNWIQFQCFGTWENKINCLQKATVRLPWITNDMATAQNVGTAGWIFFIAWRRTAILAWFTPSMVTGYRFWGGPIALHGLVHFPNTTGASLTKVFYVYFDRISYTLKGFPRRKMHLFNRLIILWWCFTSSWGFVIFALYLPIPVGDTRTPTHDTKIGYQRKKSRQNHHLMLHWMVKTMVSCDFSPKSRPNKVKSMPPKVLRCDSWSYRSTAVSEKHMQAMGQNPVTFRMKVS